MAYEKRNEVQEALRLRRTRKCRNGIAPARPEVTRDICGRGMLSRSQLHVWRAGKLACLCFGLHGADLDHSEALGKFKKFNELDLK
jgi:hypothetical protein